MKICIVLFFLIGVNKNIFGTFISRMWDNGSHLLRRQSHQAREAKVTSSCSWSPSHMLKRCRWREINLITAYLHDADWEMLPRRRKRRCVWWHTATTTSHGAETRESAAPIWLEAHRRSFEAAPSSSGRLCDFGGFRPLVEQWASVKSRKDQQQCCPSRGGEART